MKSLVVRHRVIPLLNPFVRSLVVRYGQFFEFLSCEIWDDLFVKSLVVKHGQSCEIINRDARDGPLWHVGCMESRIKLNLPFNPSAHMKRNS